MRKGKSQLVSKMPQIEVEVNFKVVLSVVRGRIVATVVNINRILYILISNKNFVLSSPVVSFSHLKHEY